MIPTASYSPSSGTDIRGNLDEWRERVPKHAIGDMQKLVAWVGLSSCLPPLLNEQGIIYHFHRELGVRKAALLQLVASINGNDSKSGNGKSLIESWNATPNAFEVTLEQRNRITASIDKLGMYRGPKIGDTIYALANGKGKQWMPSKTLRNVELASWLFSIISSGEVSIQERFRDGGETVKGGLPRCSTDLPATSEYVQPYEDESGEDYGRRIDMTKTNSAQFYGTAGRTFIEDLVNLTDDESEMRNHVKDMYQYASDTLVYRCELCGDQLNTVQKWLLERFAAPSTATFLVYNSGILEWDEDEIFATLMTASDAQMVDIRSEIDLMQEALLNPQNTLNVEHWSSSDLSRNPHLARHMSVGGILLPRQQMLTLPKAINIWFKDSGFNTRQIVKALDVRRLLIRVEKGRLASHKLLESKSYNDFITDDAFLTAKLA